MKRGRDFVWVDHHDRWLLCDLEFHLGTTATQAGERARFSGQYGSARLIADNYSGTAHISWVNNRLRKLRRVGLVEYHSGLPAVWYVVPDWHDRLEAQVIPPVDRRSRRSRVRTGH